MSEQTLRNQLVRLAHVKPKLRPHLLPLLTKHGGKVYLGPEAPQQTWQQKHPLTTSCCRCGETALGFVAHEASVQVNWDAEVKKMDLLRKQMQNLRKKVSNPSDVLTLLPKFKSFGLQAISLAETTLDSRERASASISNPRLTDHLSSARKHVVDLKSLNEDPLKYKSYISYGNDPVVDLPYHYDRILKDLWYDLRGASSYIQSLSLRR